MRTRLRCATPVSGRLLRGPAKALLLMMVSGMAASLHAQSAGLSADRSNDRAGTFSLLYSFQCTPDGEYPEAGLVLDSSGNLYGTTNLGGQQGAGTVFKVTPGGTETVLHDFLGVPVDGGFPYLGSLTLDAAGDVYGTTSGGGEFDCGTVFKVTATGAESVLHYFDGGSSGCEPQGGLARDSAGDLYGTTRTGGEYDDGLVFRLTPGGTYSVLHNFGSSPTDGLSPTGDLVREASGDLIGTTESGGASGSGTVFQVTASGTESLLYSFEGGSVDGASPYGGGLLRDTSGNLYGATEYGGSDGDGVLFKLTPEDTESVLLNFNGLSRGGEPIDGLARDTAGNLYGTTLLAGSKASCINGCGVLFMLTPAGREVVLHNFSLSSSSDGALPYGGVVRDPSGTLYGTLLDGGAHGCGAIFKYVP